LNIFITAFLSFSKRVADNIPITCYRRPASNGTVAYDLALLPIVSIKAKVALKKSLNIELVVEIN